MVISKTQKKQDDPSILWVFHRGMSHPPHPISPHVALIPFSPQLGRRPYPLTDEPPNPVGAVYSDGVYSDGLN